MADPSCDLLHLFPGGNRSPADLLDGDRKEAVLEGSRDQNRDSEGVAEVKSLVY